MNRYREKIKLSLIIYMHRISDRSMSGSLSRSFNLFNRLCGGRAIEHVRFVTSMWDIKVDKIVAKRREDRESELTSNFWKPLIDAGAQYKRFENTWASAWDIIRDATAERSEAVLLQEELVDAKRTLNETTAGKAAYSEFWSENILQAQKEALRQLIDQVKLQHDLSLMKDLEDECRMIEARLEETRKEMEEPNIPYLRRVFLLLFPKKTRSVSVLFWNV